MKVINTIIYHWVLMGLGVYLGLIIPIWNKAFDNYTAFQLIKGFVATVTLWPIALWNNRNQKQKW